MPKEKEVATKLLINELSNVDFPAQEPALSLIIKRKGGDGISLMETIAKLADVSYLDFLKEHLENSLPSRLHREMAIRLDALDSTIRRIVFSNSIPDKEAQVKKAIEDFSNEFEVGLDEFLVILNKAANGGKVTKQKEVEMPKPKEPVGSEVPENETTEEAVKRLTKSVENLTAIGKKQQTILDMSPDDIAIYKSLETEEEQNSFIEMSDDEREAFVNKRKEDEETVTLADGSVVKRSDLGEVAFNAVVKQQKAIDENKDELAKQRKEMELVTLTKRANEEFDNIPGASAEEVAGLLYDSTNMSKTSRDVLTKILKSSNEVISKAEMFNADFELGTSKEDVSDASPDMVETEKALQEQHPEMVAKDK